jgi:hypothetical protein
MEEVRAVPVESVIGSKATDDGQFVLVKLRRPDGNELKLAIPPNEVYRLIGVAAHSIEDCRAKLKTDPEERFMYHTSWFEIGRSRKDGKGVLTQTFGAGGRLAFHFDMTMAERMLEALGVLTGRAIPPKPDTPTH